MNKPYYETEEYSEAENELDTYDDPVKLVMEYRVSEKQKDEQIADLQHRLKVTEKALELACDCIPCKKCSHSGGKSFCYIASEDGSSPNDWECNTAKYSYFNEQAEKELQGE